MGKGKTLSEIPSVLSLANPFSSTLQVRQRRELRKEKKFQAKLINKIKEAEKFSAEQYVMEKIREATENPIPRYWKGRRLPEFIIKEKLGIK